jgi:hypothetical protein
MFGSGQPCTLRGARADCGQKDLVQNPKSEIQKSKLGVADGTDQELHQREMGGFEVR